MGGCNEFEGVGMSEQQRFSHITVSSDDDEVVILAGAPREAEASSERTRRGEKLSEKDGASEAPASSSKAHEDEAESLDAEPMPFTQKVVIAAAAVLIIAFIVYQVFFV